MNSLRYDRLPDPELVARRPRHDSKAWEALIHRYKRRIFSIALRFGLSPSDAADVFQSVCIKLLKHLPLLRDESKVSAWLTTTTTRQCAHMKTQERRLVADPEEAGTAGRPWEDLDEIRIIAQTRQTVRKALDQLPERCQELLRMLYFEVLHRTYEEVVRALGMPVSSSPRLKSDSS